MAKCKNCGKEMTKAKGCDIPNVGLACGTRKRLKHDEPGRCPDCGATKGHYHHPGCDWEKCPVCHGQLISCDC